MALSKEAALSKDRRSAGSNMEHRHFAVVADIIQQLAGKEREKIAHHFANRLGNTNPRFNRSRFLRACGVED